MPPDDEPPVLIVAKTEVKRLASQNADRSLRWPEPQALTWVRTRHMPWMLAGFEPATPVTT